LTLGSAAAGAPEGRDGLLARQIAPDRALRGDRAHLLAWRRREYERVLGELLVERDLDHLGERERLSVKPGLDPQQRSPFSVAFQAQLVGFDDAEPSERPVVMAPATARGTGRTRSVGRPARCPAMISMAAHRPERLSASAYFLHFAQRPSYDQQHRVRRLAEAAHVVWDTPVRRFRHSITCRQLRRSLTPAWISRTSAPPSAPVCRM
jgi:hypothetical protein